MTERPRRDATRPFAIFTVLMILVMIFPVYGFANRVDPMVLGLPFGLFWIVFWIGVEFVALICFYLYEHGGRG